MTFEQWWHAFLVKWGKPDDEKQELLAKAVAKTAWDAGRQEGIRYSTERAMELNVERRSS